MIPSALVSIVALAGASMAMSEPIGWDMPGTGRRLAVIASSRHLWFSGGNDLLRIGPNGSIESKLSGPYGQAPLIAIGANGSRIYALFNQSNSTEFDFFRIDAESLQVRSSLRYRLEGFEERTRAFLVTEDEAVTLAACSRARCAVMRLGGELEVLESLTFRMSPHEVTLEGALATPAGILLYGRSEKAPWAALFASGELAWSKTYVQSNSEAFTGAINSDGRILLAGSAWEHRISGGHQDLVIVDVELSGKVVRGARFGYPSTNEESPRLFSRDGAPWLLFTSRHEYRGEPHALVAPVDLRTDTIPATIIASGAHAHSVATVGADTFAAARYSGVQTIAMQRLDDELVFCDADDVGPTPQLYVSRAEPVAERHDAEVEKLEAVAEDSPLVFEVKPGPQTIVHCLRERILDSENPKAALAADPTRSEVAEALSQQRFDDLEGIAAAHLSDQDWGSLADFYSTFAESRSSDLSFDRRDELIEKWLVAHPKSPVAATALARVLEVVAWSERTRSAYDDRPDRSDEILERAWKALNASAWKRSGDPELHRMRMVLAKRGGFADFEREHERAIGVAQAYYETYLTAAVFRGPDWGGSWTDVADYFAMIDEQTRGSLGDLLQPRFAMAAYSWRGSPAALGLDWSRARDGFLELIDSGRNAPVYELWAYRLGQSQDDQEFLERLRRCCRPRWDIHAQEVFRGDIDLFRRAIGPQTFGPSSVPASTLSERDGRFGFNLETRVGTFEVWVDDSGEMVLEQLESELVTAFELEQGPRILPSAVAHVDGECSEDECRLAFIEVEKSGSRGGGGGLFNMSEFRGPAKAFDMSPIKPGLPVVNRLGRVIGVVRGFRGSKVRVSMIRPGFLKAGHDGIVETIAPIGGD